MSIPRTQQSGGLTQKQLEWCDLKLCEGRFKKFREQAELVAAETAKSREACKCGDTA